MEDIGVKYMTHLCIIAQTQKGEKMGLIDIQEVIDAMAKKIRYADYADPVIGWHDFVTTLRSLPSAQPEPIRINLNEPIKVKLTDWGKEIYYHQYDRVNKAVGREVCKPRYPTEDEKGYTEFQLWCFMELYGEHIGMTLPNVIEPLEIVYESGERREDDIRESTT